MAEPPPPITPWPLSAATTRTLLKVSASYQRPILIKPGEVTKLAVKELVLRGAWEITGIERRRLRRPRVTVAPGPRPPDLPTPVNELDQLMRAQGGGDLKDVIWGVRRGTPRFGRALVGQVQNELAARGLIQVNMLLTRANCVRTPLGNQWAMAAEHHLAAFRALPDLVERDPNAGERIALAGAALLLMVPGALASVARLRRRRGARRRHVRSRGHGFEEQADGLDAVPILAGSFDVLAAFDSAFAEILDAAEGAIDGAGQAVDSAIDSAAGAIDSAIDSGVDAGGGSDGGSDGGGGGGGDGGGD